MMKKIALLNKKVLIGVIVSTIILLLIANFALAENNIYMQDSLELQLDVQGSLNLVSTGSNPLIKDLQVNIFLSPGESFRQKVLDLSTSSDGAEVEKANNKITYSWAQPSLEKKDWGYTAKIKTFNERLPVTRKIAFPLADDMIQNYKEYTHPTEKIDSDNPKIIQKATELAEGEDDLFKVTFKLASWVEENVNYQLNSLTTDQAQKASWVLENKQGVCDEMTSLFVAMCRSLGIPAKFVSGISYTDNQEVVQAVGKNWAGHGWAEAYFPNVGWVSFDIPFGEYGYIDVTHLKLREGFDPDEPATKYSWLSSEVELKPNKLQMDVKLLKKGNYVPEEIQLAESLLASEVQIGSYNLIKGIVKNPASYYAATTLKLALPREVEIIGRNRRNILLAPGEVKETYWIVQVSPLLEEDYLYQFPVVIYSEKNVSVSDSFTAKAEGSFYSADDIEELTVQDEEKSYSRKVLFTCDYPKTLSLSEKAEFKCEIKNVGNTNLERVNFCLGQVCDYVDLLINQKKSTMVKVMGEKVGWNKIIVSAENELIEKKTALEYQVLDTPKVLVEIAAPEKVQYGSTFQMKFVLKKDSFVVPKMILITVKGGGLESKWELSELSKDENLVLELSSARMSRENKFQIITTWKDAEDKAYSEKQEIMISGEAANLADRMKMFLNGIVGWFYRD